MTALKFENKEIYIAEETNSSKTTKVLDLTNAMGNRIF